MLVLGSAIALLWIIYMYAVVVPAIIGSRPLAKAGQSFKKMSSAGVSRLLSPDPMSSTAPATTIDLRSGQEVNISSACEASAPHFCARIAQSGAAVFSRKWHAARSPTASWVTWREEPDQMDPCGGSTRGTHGLKHCTLTSYP